MRGFFLGLFSDTLITFRGEEIRVTGKHKRLEATIARTLNSFLPKRGWVTITGKRIAAHGGVKRHEQSIRNILNIDLRL